jgi:hypothetical protein
MPKRKSPQNRMTGVDIADVIRWAGRPQGRHLCEIEEERSGPSKLGTNAEGE